MCIGSTFGVVPPTSTRRIQAMFHLGRRTQNSGSASPQGARQRAAPRSASASVKSRAVGEGWTSLRMQVPLPRIIHRVRKIQPSGTLPPGPKIHAAREANVPALSRACSSRDCWNIMVAHQAPTLDQVVTIADTQVEQAWIIRYLPRNRTFRQ
jgi:hypothetical protein